MTPNQIFNAEKRLVTTLEHLHKHVARFPQHREVCEDAVEKVEAAWLALAKARREIETHELMGVA